MVDDYSGLRGNLVFTVVDHVFGQPGKGLNYSLYLKRNINNLEHCFHVKY